MYHATRIELKKLPSVANHTVRSAFSRNTNIRNPELPNMDAVIYGHVPSKKNVKDYASICGFDTKSELLHPLGEGSPIQGFLDKNPSGGIHHVCYEVGDIMASRDHLKAQGARVLGDGEPKIGAHGKPVLFLHPKDFNGCLVELEQV
mgnify:CR=1 FL=1